MLSLVELERREHGLFRIVPKCVPLNNEEHVSNLIKELATLAWIRWRVVLKLDDLEENSKQVMKLAETAMYDKFFRDVVDNLRGLKTRTRYWASDFVFKHIVESHEQLGFENVSMLSFHSM